MGNDPRWVPPGSLVEVTQTTLHGRYLLRPSRELVDLFNGVLLRAAERYEVEVCAFVCLSNHSHLLGVPQDAAALSATLFAFSHAQYLQIDGFNLAMLAAVRYLGVVLAMDEWDQLAGRLRAADTRFVIEPHIRFKGQVGEQATMFFLDPCGNALEFKAFADPSRLFAK